VNVALSVQTVIWWFSCWSFYPFWFSCCWRGTQCMYQHTWSSFTDP